MVLLHCCCCLQDEYELPRRGVDVNPFHAEQQGIKRQVDACAEEIEVSILTTSFALLPVGLQVTQDSLRLIIQAKSPWRLSLYLSLSFERPEISYL